MFQILEQFVHPVNTQASRNLILVLCLIPDSKRQNTHSVTRRCQQNSVPVTSCHLLCLKLHWVALTTSYLIPPLQKKMLLTELLYHRCQSEVFFSEKNCLL